MDEYGRSKFEIGDIVVIIRYGSKVDPFVKTLI